jgi:cytochrome oxidase assembly protein ShyY1
VLVPDPHKFKISREYRRVWVAGNYEGQKTILVRNRPLNGIQGFQVVTPLRLTSGDYILVDRGWVPTGASPAVPARFPKPGNSELLVVGRLKSTEPVDSRTAPSGQTLSINAKAIFKQVGLANAQVYTGSYLLLEQESIAAPTGKLSTKPSLNEGNHLSYAFQWVLFALMAFAAIGWGIRQDRLMARAAQDPTFVIKKRKRVGDEDKAAEDALLDD